MTEQWWHQKCQMQRERYDAIIGRDNTPVAVQIVWLSDDENTYHYCLNCSQYGQIKDRNFQTIMLRDTGDEPNTITVDGKKYEPCVPCRQTPLCDNIVFFVSK